MPELVISLEVDDGWPPVAAECLRCAEEGDAFRVEAAPLFVRELSVGDIIQILEGSTGQVKAWGHLSKSDHSTVWLLAHGGFPLEEPMAKLRAMGCSTTRLDAFNLASVDVPPSTSSAEVDAALNSYGKAQLSVAYPSWRHE